MKEKVTNSCDYSGIQLQTVKNIQAPATYAQALSLGIRLSRTSTTTDYCQWIKYRVGKKKSIRKDARSIRASRSRSDSPPSEFRVKKVHLHTVFWAYISDATQIHLTPGRFRLGAAFPSRSRVKQAPPRACRDASIHLRANQLPCNRPRPRDQIAHLGAISSLARGPWIGTISCIGCWSATRSRFRTASSCHGSAPRVWRPALRGSRPRSLNRNTETPRNRPRRFCRLEPDELGLGADWGGEGGTRVYARF